QEAVQGQAAAPRVQGVVGGVLAGVGQRGDALVGRQPGGGQVGQPRQHPRRCRDQLISRAQTQIDLLEQPAGGVVAQADAPRPPVVPGQVGRQGGGDGGAG